MKKLLKSRRGETLLETVVALTIFVLILAGTGATIASAVNIIKSSNEEYESFRAEVVSVEKEENISTAEKINTKYNIKFSIKNDGVSGSVKTYTSDDKTKFVLTEKGLTYFEK